MLQPLPVTFTSASLLVSALFAKFMVVARTVELALDDTLRVVAVLSEKCCRRLRKLECWNRIRRLGGDQLRRVGDGIWIGLLLRHYMPGKGMSKFDGCANISVGDSLSNSGISIEN